MKRLKTPLRVLAFLLVLAISYSVVQYAFSLPSYSIYYQEKLLTRETPGSLDAITVGSSNIFFFLEPPLLWKDYGIAVYNDTIPNQPYQALRLRIMEARKTQPDALYIISLNSFHGENNTVEKAHRSVDYFPLSLNRLRLIQLLADNAGLSFWDRLELYFPIIRFHSRWSQMTTLDFVHPLNDLKGATVRTDFLNSVFDTTQELVLDDDPPDTEDAAAAMEELLDYLDRENVNALFLITPQYLSEESYECIFSMKELTAQRGYSCLDLSTVPEEIGIQPDVDYADRVHLNVHGAIKLTDYIGRWLSEHYDFADKRGQAGYESWDESVELYTTRIDRYSLPFERDHAPRAYDLAAPVLSKPTQKGENAIVLKWQGVEGAEGYQVFRRTTQENYWAPVATLDASAERYVDTDLSGGPGFAYTVVPVVTRDGTLCYGNFQFSGVTIKLEVTES